MAPVRNGVLARVVTPAAGGAATFGTVPSTDTWLVKAVNVYNAGNAAAVATIIANAPASAVIAVLLSQSIAAGASVSLQTWFAMGPGDFVQYSTGAQPFHVWVSGADLPGHL